MRKDNVVPFRHKKCKELEEGEYIEGAINCLEQARFCSRGMKDNPMMLSFVRENIRGIFIVLNKTNGVTLDEIGTTFQELKSLVSPPELGLTQKAIDSRLEWVLGGDKNIPPLDK